MLRRLSTEILHSIVGAVVILALAGYMAYGYTTNVRGAAPSDSYPLTAEFRSVDGITEGSRVKLAGVTVGQVTRLEFRPETNGAVLHMRIRNGIDIPYDSVAMIVSDGVFGDKFVKVAPGGDFDMLLPGEEFEFVQDSLILEELLERVILAAEARHARPEGQQEDRGDDDR